MIDRFTRQQSYLLTGIEFFEAALKLQFGTFYPLVPVEVHSMEKNPRTFSSNTLIYLQLKKEQSEHLGWHAQIMTNSDILEC